MMVAHLLSNNLTSGEEWNVLNCKELLLATVEIKNKFSQGGAEANHENLICYVKFKMAA